MTNDNIKTPAMLFDLDQLAADAGSVSKTCRDNDVQLLYPLKTCALRAVLLELLKYVDGFAVSSVYEALLAREIATNAPIQFTSPGLTDQEIPQVAEVCDVIVANSLGQLERLRAKATGVELGLRVNPQISVVDDERYDPCRRHSKLGVPLDRLTQELKHNPQLLEGVSGIHFHSASEMETFPNLLRTTRHLLDNIGNHINGLDWINLGGGYLFEDTDGFATFTEVKQLLEPMFEKVIMEPGTAVVADCCSLHSTVIDLFESEGKMVAVLDTTVNHLPETLEFEYLPPVAEADEKGGRDYILAGGTCLAGDVFGEYSFSSPLGVGARITFENCGSYTLVKAQMFNGISLPTLYKTSDGGTKITKLREFGFEDYASRFG